MVRSAREACEHVRSLAAASRRQRTVATGRESCEGLGNQWAYIIVGLLALGRASLTLADLSNVCWQQLSQRYVSHGLRGALTGWLTSAARSLLASTPLKRSEHIAINFGGVGRVVAVRLSYSLRAALSR